MQKAITYPEVGEVTLSRTRRSTRITLSVRPNGSVRLSFPPWVTQKRALKFLDEKTEWITTARGKMAEKYPDLVGSGPAGTGTIVGMGASDAVGITGGTGVLPETAAEAAARLAAEKAAEKRLIEALRAEAKLRLPEMVDRIAAEHGFRHGTVRIKVTKSRWGSCTVRNDINLSLALSALPDRLAEYIVLHELCHTVHKNHSPKFHALLDHVTGGQSKALNKELRKYRPDVALFLRRDSPQV